jgi:hypothetical protein
MYYLADFGYKKLDPRYLDKIRGMSWDDKKKIDEKLDGWYEKHNVKADYLNSLKKQSSPDKVELSKLKNKLN